MVLKTLNFQMLPEITIIHCFNAIYCQNGVLKTYSFQMLPEITLSIALLQSTVKMVLKTFNLQMLPEITIIHCFLAISCPNSTKNIELSNASRN